MTDSEPRGLPWYTRPIVARWLTIALVAGAIGWVLDLTSNPVGKAVLALCALPVLVSLFFGNRKADKADEEWDRNNQAEKEKNAAAMREQEVREQQAQHEAQQEAALDAKLAQLRQTGAPTPSGQRSPEAQSLANEIKSFWKK